MRNIYKEDVERAARKVRYEITMVEKVIKETSRRKESIEEWNHVLLVLRFAWKNAETVQPGLPIPIDKEAIFNEM